MPTVSVIMPAYNVESYIHGAINSVLNQTLQDLELIVIDDGSTDQTLETIKGFDDPRLKVLTQTNKGEARARNRGIEESKGKYIATLDADDIAFSNRLRRQINFLEERTKIGIVGSYSYVLRDRTNEVTLSPRPKTDSDIRKSILMVNPFIHSTTVFRAEVFRSVGMYRPSKNDFELMVRVLKKYKGANIPKPLCLRRERSEGIILSKGLFEHLKEIIEIRIKAIKELKVPLWRWPQLAIPVMGLMLSQIGLNKEVGHQLVSNGLIQTIKRMNT